MASPPTGATALGSHFYLFKSATNTEDCLISAHGGYKKTTGTFVPRGVSLLFYGVHGNVLRDPGLTLMYLRNLRIMEEFPNRETSDCPNYILSKYQGRHNTAGETYEKIAGKIESEDQSIDRLRDRIANAASEARRSLARNQLESYKSMSVLTIRNRWWRADMNLESAVNAAKAEMPSLIRFHCSFCRSLVGDDDAGTSVVQFA